MCDWSVPGVGETAESVTWVSVGGDELQPPHQVVNVVARSSGPAAPVAAEVLPTHTALTPPSLPATGGGEPPWAFLAAALLVIAALTLRPARRPS